MSFLSITQSKLVDFTTERVVKELIENQNYSSVKEQSFSYFSESTNEIFQVQIIATRSQSDFLEDFQKECMTEFKP